MGTMTKLTSPVLAAILALGCLPTASADQSAAAKPAVTVTYADLDVGTTEGATALLRRVKLAAREACEPARVPGPMQPRATSQYRDCVAEAVDIAVARIDIPLVAELHRAQPTNAILASR